jgi:hypothetical protein
VRKALIILFFALLQIPSSAIAQKILIQMDLRQTDHLKAYGVAFWSLERGMNVEWLLNYRGGAFMIDYYPEIERELRLRGVSSEMVGGADIALIYNTMEEENMEVVLLEKAPRIAVYTPQNKQPWDDAVTLALAYAEVPYDKIWDKEVLQGDLEKYDWLHLHHEDFTGQYGKFYASFRSTPWYIEEVRMNEAMAVQLGFKKVSELKRAVAQIVKDFVIRGGFLFAMCSATDSFDIALAASQTDVVPDVFDGDPPEPNCQAKLDFSQSLAFKDFQLEMNPFVYEYSDIDIPPNYAAPLRGADADAFTLFEFSAKYDPVPVMLTQNHVNVVKGFMGQTTGFRRSRIKKSLVLLGEIPETENVKYIHGNQGRGTFTFLAGHDPEDYQHAVGDPPTQLSLHRNSPGYRLILNNILFPAAKKKKRKT